jgi:tetratricopeptide (TPR) repeat protein
VSRPALLPVAIGARPRTSAAALVATGGLAWWHGEHEEARAVLEQSIALLEREPDADAAAWATLNLGVVTAKKGDEREAIRLFTEAATAYRALDDPRGVAIALHNWGCVRFMLGDYDSVVDDCSNAAKLSAGLGDEQHEAPVLRPSRTRAARWRASLTWRGSRIVSSTATTPPPSRTSRTTVFMSRSAT